MSGFVRWIFYKWVRSFKHALDRFRCDPMILSRSTCKLFTHKRDAEKSFFCLYLIYITHTVQKLSLLSLLLSGQKETSSVWQKKRLRPLIIFLHFPEHLSEKNIVHNGGGLLLVTRLYIYVYTLSVYIIWWSWKTQNCGVMIKKSFVRFSLIIIYVINKGGFLMHPCILFL